MAKSQGIGCLWWIVLGIFGLCAVVALRRDPQPAEDLPKIDAVALFKAYRDVKKADEKFKGKRWQVSGTILGISKNSEKKRYSATLDCGEGEEGDHAVLVLGLPSYQADDLQRKTSRSFNCTVVGLAYGSVALESCTTS